MARNNISVLQQMAMDESETEGLLPHEWLKRIVDGQPIRQMIPVKTASEDPDESPEITWVEKDFYPNLDTRIECAKASSQFFAPKYTAIKASIDKQGGRLTHLSDEEIDEMLDDLARTDSDDNNGVIYDNTSD